MLIDRKIFMKFQNFLNVTWSARWSGQLLSEDLISNLNKKKDFFSESDFQIGSLRGILRKRCGEINTTTTAVTAGASANEGTLCGRFKSQPGGRWWPGRRAICGMKSYQSGLSDSFPLELKKTNWKKY